MNRTRLEELANQRGETDAPDADREALRLFEARRDGLTFEEVDAGGLERDYARFMDRMSARKSPQKRRDRGMT